MSKPHPSRRIDHAWRHKDIDPHANLALAQQREEDVTPANRTRWRAFQSVLRAAGIDPATLTWDECPYTAAVVRQRWVEPHAADWDGFAAEVLGYPPLEQAQWKPVFALGFALLRLFGLEHCLVCGHMRRYVRYVVDAATLEQQREQFNKRERNTRAQD